MARVAGLFAALLLTGCGGSDATLAMFAGTWQGHTRGLVITRAGAARESIYSGCCTFGLAVRFQLSDPKGTARAASAIATVTAVRIGDKSAFTRANPAPRVGEKRTIRLKDGVITETLTGTNYCRPGLDPKHWVCGA
jgi:hypothetical protein